MARSFGTLGIARSSLMRVSRTGLRIALDRPQAPRDSRRFPENAAVLGESVPLNHCENLEAWCKLAVSICRIVSIYFYCNFRKQVP